MLEINLLLTHVIGLKNPITIASPTFKTFRRKEILIFSSKTSKFYHLAPYNFRNILYLLDEHFFPNLKDGNEVF